MTTAPSLALNNTAMYYLRVLLDEASLISRSVVKSMWAVLCEVFQRQAFFSRKLWPGVVAQPGISAPRSQRSSKV